MKTMWATQILSISLCVLNTHEAANAQGTITFNNPWIDNGVGGLSLAYFDGFSFGSGNRTQPFEGANHIGATGPSGYPHNGTPYAAFINTLGMPQYMKFAWTNAATFGDHSFLSGAPFGLVSADLADPVAPSLSPVSITFNGFKGNGLIVSQTFTVGGGGSSTFQTVTFSPDFVADLLRVEIPSPRWAMDNLVWIPEPAAGSLLVLGLLALAGRRRFFGRPNQR